jgi:hypothetical protein
MLQQQQQQQQLYAPFFLFFILSSVTSPLHLIIMTIFLPFFVFSEKPETVDVTFADFDGVQFHVSASPDAKHLLKISAQFKGAQQVLKEFGGLELLKRYYGPLVQSTPEASYDVTLQIDLNNLPPGKGIYHPYHPTSLRHILNHSPLAAPSNFIPHRALL